MSCSTKRGQNWSYVRKPYKRACYFRSLKICTMNQNICTKQLHKISRIQLPSCLHFLRCCFDESKTQQKLCHIIPTPASHTRPVWFSSFLHSTLFHSKNGLGRIRGTKLFLSRAIYIQSYNSSMY